MRLAYFDCLGGAAGDMIVGALLDAGLELESLRQALTGLNLPGYSLSSEKVRRAGLAGTKFNVNLVAQVSNLCTGTPGQAKAQVENLCHHPRRRLSDILAIIDSAGLPGRAAETAKAVFTRLGQAEAKVHGIAVEQVHFHEVGAVDSIVDIVSSAVGLELLGIEEVYCSPIPAGSGAVKTEHGLLPVPAPATAELLKGALVAPGPVGPGAGQPGGELTTPTGAAILTTLAKGYGPVPPMSVSAVGYGAGAREGGVMPNLLRVMLGAAGPDGSADAVVELSANLDDCTGQVLGATLEKLLEGPCLDAWCTPIYMKKSRPAWMLSALCLPGDADRAEAIIFAQTTTLGVRRRLCGRSKLLRRHVTVETRYGPIRVKIGSDAAGRELTAAPEFADCAAAAEAHGVPVKEVLAAALRTYGKP